jgi:hypothetical protein
MKKKVDQGEINSFKNRLYFKIFNIVTINNVNYYIDNEFNLIWDNKQDVVGIIHNNKNIFFDELDHIINSINNIKLYN